MATRAQKRPRKHADYEPTCKREKKRAKVTKADSNYYSLQDVRQRNKTGIGRRKNKSSLFQEQLLHSVVHIDPLIQEALIQDIESTKVEPPGQSNEVLNISDSEDDDGEWLQAYIEKSVRKRKEAELAKASTKGMKDTFQHYFLNKLSLKSEVVTIIGRIKGVKGIGWGFTQHAKGQEPVIRIRTPNLTDSASLLEEVATAIQAYISENYKIDCMLEEILGYIDISESTESSASVKILQSKPGDEVQTAYNSSGWKTLTGYLTGFVYAQLEIEINGLKCIPIYDAHYPILPFHCILPAECESFRTNLPEISKEKEDELGIKVYFENVCEGVPVATGKDSPHQIPTMLKATCYPNISSQSIGLMEHANTLKYTIMQSGDNLQGFLTGKAGMIGKTKNNKYIPVIMMSPEYAKTHVPFCTHPCTVDIAACKIHEARQCNHCSIKEALDYPCKLQGPSEIRDLKGEVHMLNNGKIIKLANNLLDVEFCATDGSLSFPCFQWKNEDQSIEETYIVSGSPAFIKQGESSFFLGGLYTPETAFNSDFALEIIRPDICEHFIGDVIEILKRKITNERKAAMKTTLQRAVNHLEKFQKRIITLKCNKITAWDDEISLSELHKSPQEDSGIIKCKVEFCINRHATKH